MRRLCICRPDFQISQRVSETRIRDRGEVEGIGSGADTGWNARTRQHGEIASHTLREMRSAQPLRIRVEARIGYAARREWVKLQSRLIRRCEVPVSYTHLRAHETDSYLV